MTSHAPEPTPAAAFPALYAAMRAGAALGDFWAQTEHQATTKAAAGTAGRRACATHAAVYTACQAAGVLAANHLLDLRIRPARLAALLAVSGLTHHVIDRRTPLKRLAGLCRKTGFYDLAPPLGGAFHLDQAAHHLIETCAALAVTTSRRT